MQPTTFLERGSQVDAVLGYAGEADAGSGRLVLVEGEAGVGKSTLLEQAEARLPEATWHWGACDGLFTPLPLAPLRDIAEDAGGDLRDALRADAPREQLFAALLGTIRGRTTLTVLVVEDVHWADEATLDLLRYIGRRIQKERVLVLVTFRDEEAGAGGALRRALGELSRQRATRRITLPPLSPTAVGQLLAGTGLDPAQVHALTGGNPYFVTEVASHGGAAFGGARDAALPASARDAVLARVAPLDPDARALLDAAALAGTRVDPALMAAVVGGPDTAAETLLAAGLLVTDGTTMRFRHEIARLAVAEAVSAPTRAGLHARILAALLERGDGDDSRLAFHAEGAGDLRRAFEHSTAAAARAAGLAAHREALEHCLRAYAAAQALGVDDRVLAGILDALATELGLADRWDEAEHLRAEALALWRRLGDPLREGEALRLRSQALIRMAQGAEARAAIAESCRVLEPLGATAELARTLQDLAGISMVHGEHRAALEQADRSAALAELFDLPDVLSNALDTRACSLSPLGEPWEPEMRRALHVARTRGCDEQAARAYTNYYAMLIDEGRLADGEPLYLEGRQFCEDHEVHTYGNCLAASRVTALELAGRWAEAHDLGWSRLAGVDRVSPSNWMNFALSLGRIGVRRGDAGVDDVVARATAAAEGTAEPQWIVQFRLLNAEQAWLAGRLDAARQAVASAAEAVCAVPTEWVHAGPVAVWARRLGVPVPAPSVDVVLWAPELRGDVPGAVEQWDAVGAPYQAALALAFSPEPDDRVEALRRLEELGATVTAAVVRRRLREDGVRSLPGAARASTRSHPAGLTTREQEVLELLARGCTNEEVAAALVISVKTAGHHVSAVLAKLGVANRRQAVAEAGRRGLLAGSEPGVQPAAR